MKFNWGFGITLFIILFVGFMLILVFNATKQNHELVTENYYEKELEFKDILVKKKRALNTFKEQVKIDVKSEELIIIYPIEVTTTITGNILFFKPSSKKEDKLFEINTKDNKQTIPLSSLTKGMYKVKIDWTTNNNEFYNELTVVIP